MENKRDEALPLGSVVILKDDESYMIMGYNALEKDSNTKYDYIGCDSSYGMTVKSRLFNEADIKKVEFYGFTDPTIIKINKIIRNEGN